MDVRCDKCQTEYEFDDALVTSRGTSVKCTQCGNQFKVSREGDDHDDKWTVESSSGEALKTFSSLRELQRGILARTIGKADFLVRGSVRREIGQIAELMPFFDDATRTSSPPSSSIQPVAAPVKAPATEAGAGAQAAKPLESSAAAAPPEKQPTPPATASAPPTRPTKPPPLPQRASMVPLVNPTARHRVDLPKPGRMPSIPPPLPERASSSKVPGARKSDAPSEAPKVASFMEEATKVEELPAARTDSNLPPMRGKLDSASVDVLERPSRLPPPTINVEEEAKPPSIAPAVPKSAPVPRVSVPPKKGKTPLAAFVVIGSVAVVGAYLMGRNRPDEAKPVVTHDVGRVSALVAEGDKSLAAGDLDGAKEAYDKASAIAEKDPAVRVGLARLAVLRADELWLKLRLLPVDASDDLAIVKKGLAQASDKAQKATEEAGTAEPVVLAARVSALRIAGDVRSARGLAVKLGVGTDAEASYALAALDLAESEDVRAPTLERFRAIANAEGANTRGRVALVYALAKSGAAADAKAELEKLGTAPTPPALLPTLRSFVARSRALGDGGVAFAPPADAGAAPSDLTGGSTSAAGAPPAAAGGDVRLLVSQGQQARAKGDYDKARTLFNSALEKNPNDSEALNGLAECARGQRDLNGARAAYKRVLSVNPGYLPALVGYADVEWELGNQGAAQKAYKDIVDGFPAASYPARVRQRATDGTGGGGGAPP